MLLETQTKFEKDQFSSLKDSIQKLLYMTDQSETSRYMHILIKIKLRLGDVINTQSLKKISSVDQKIEPGNCFI